VVSLIHRIAVAGIVLDSDLRTGFTAVARVDLLGNDLHHPACGHLGKGGVARAVQGHQMLAIGILGAGRFWQSGECPTSWANASSDPSWRYRSSSSRSSAMASTCSTRPGLSPAQQNATNSRESYRAPRMPRSFSASAEVRSIQSSSSRPDCGSVFEPKSRYPSRFIAGDRSPHASCAPGRPVLSSGAPSGSASQTRRKPPTRLSSGAGQPTQIAD